MLLKICSYVQIYVAMSKEPTVGEKDWAKGSFQRGIMQSRKNVHKHSAMSVLNTWWVGKINLNQSHVRLLLMKKPHRHDPPRWSSAIKKQSDTSTKTTKQVKRPCPVRKTRGKSFITVLDIAKKMKSPSIKSEIIVNEHERHFILAAASGVTYEIEINNIPNCTCKYCNDRDVCSHITWLLLNNFKVPEDDSLLHQWGYTSHELEGIFGKNNKKQCSPCQEESPRSNSKGHPTTACKWVITKHLLNTRPKCPTCHAEITKDIWR